MATNPNAVLKSQSKTVTDTLIGEHQHQIVGYSLIKGIGDGEPIASERFTVGGHEWVLLFYPDGKRSSSAEGNGGGVGDHAQFAVHGPAQVQGQQQPPPGGPAGPHAGAPPPYGGIPLLPPVPPPMPADADPAAAAAVAAGMAAPPAMQGPGADAAQAAAAAAAHAAAAHAVAGPGNIVRVVAAGPGQLQAQQQARRDTTNEYAALFVALIGEGPNPQGVVNTSEGKVVRAFHRFTLVDQSGQGRDLTKGRTRDAGAVKISCARQDPNARNCHGYRKFVKRSVLEDPARGFLVNDTIVIKYTIELVVSSGGALSGRSTVSNASRSDLVRVPPPSVGADLGKLLASGEMSDLEIEVKGSEVKAGEQQQSRVFKAHRIVLQARSEFFKALLNTPMKEGGERRVHITDIEPDVFGVLLHFIYTDSLPEDHDGNNLEVVLAQHLLVAADMYQLTRLSRMCERRLCETVDLETVGTTLALAHKNHADELKKVCLDFVSKNLAAVMNTSGFKYMTTTCPELQGELLQVVAQLGPSASGNPALTTMAGGPGAVAGGGAGALVHRPHGLGPRVREAHREDDERRVRPRRE